MRFHIRRLMPAALFLAACAGGNADPVGLAGGEEEVLFLAQTVEPNAVMQALFVGRVLADGAGCLRLDGPDPATVVWPAGFRLVSNGSTRTVQDASGATVGRIGDTFRLGGGEVPTLHDGIAVSSGDRAVAATRCPGRFWIVGDIVR